MNATILKNLVSQDIKIGTKDTALAIAESYLAKATSDLKNHRHDKVTEVKKNCVNNKSCGKRTVKKCTSCNTYQCSSYIKSQ